MVVTLTLLAEHLLTFDAGLAIASSPFRLCAILVVALAAALDGERLNVATVVVGLPGVDMEVYSCSPVIVPGRRRKETKHKQYR